ncbi:MAG: N-acetyl-1-D-myo-inositol-2-amino-2-deoxy-alpha-D-glucopyranoside deacetylase, partial [Chloroflexi bacterium]|nr:N-acetyl-1-D-myo-inositol-2-amino-2-deoxy-alpha-D-glucopyranoside deacetylase [Chloroflexota bacterium]
MANPNPAESGDLSHLRMLAAFAHPDDEGFGSGGTLAMLVERGAHVTLVCGTNGDVGEISDPALATPENLGQVRQQELRNAMDVTGVKDVRFLNYRDSGMVGTPENDHPECLHQAEAESVVEQLLDVIREVRPNVVITHDPTGGYGHPDHRAMCRHVTEAVARSRRADSGAGQRVGGHDSKASSSLYYVCFPRSNFQRMWQKMVEMDIKPPFASEDVDKVGTPDDEVTTTIDV